MNKKPSLRVSLVIILILFFVIVSGCSKSSTSANDHRKNTSPPSKKANPLPKAPQKSIGKTPSHDIYYELFVRSFYDSNGDGIGDLKGAAEKLDYLQNLGVTGIWLMPLTASPSYHGYDVTNYEKINPDYGTLQDLQTFVKEAHKRHIKVLMDLVLNHTSDQNPWFQSAISSTKSPYRDWYTWADSKTDTGALGTWGQQLWHGTKPNIYYGVFDSSMPDLNYSNPKVQNQMINVGKYWLKAADVDGYRLDAAMYIFDDQEKSIDWWYKFDQALKTVKRNVFLVGEVWDDTDVIAPYLRSLDSAFDFPLADRIISAVQKQDGSGLVSDIQQIRKAYSDTSNHYVDSIFLSNHDQNRVMSTLMGDKNKAKMAASILLTLPGNPFIYYGEEIGMQGQKPDEHIREPMPWTKDPQAKGTTTWEFSMTASPSVADELKDPNSLLNHYKTLIKERKSNPVLMNGDIQTADISTFGTLSYKRTLGDKSLLVIHNLSDQSKTVTLSKETTAFKKITFTTNPQAKFNDNKIDIPAYTTVILNKD